MTSTGRRRLRRLADRFSDARSRAGREDAAHAGAPDVLPEPTRPPLPAEPVLSVVVPVYAVERYLADCLDSVLGQSWTSLEVVVVDDGSPDGSAAIAQEYVDRDPRVRLVRQENAGLGAARNRGIAEATGDLVTFLDSDDLVPPDAYRGMVGSLVESGSDFVVGALQRLEGDELVERNWMRTLHARRRTGITIDDLPDALTNVFACTKVFRRDFLAEHDFAFPVGVRYEDQHPITRAFLLAERFDVLAEPVYTWRIRQDGSSITQQKGSAADLHDRMLAIRQVLADMHDLASATVRNGWLVKVFRHDLMAYFRAAVEAPADPQAQAAAPAQARQSAPAEDRADYFAELSSVTADLVAQAPEDVWRSVELRHRVAAHLAASGDRDGLEDLLAREDLRSSDFPVITAGADLVADLGDLDVPAGLLVLRPVDFAPRTFLSTAQLDGQVLRLGGVAFLRHLDAGRADVGVALVLRERGGPGEVRVPATRAHDEQGDLVARRSHEDHTDSGFTGDLDLAAVVAATPEGPSTTWTCSVALTADGVESVEGLRERPETGSTHAERAVVVDGALVTTAWSEREGFLVRVQRRFAAATAVRWDGTDALVDLVVAGVEPTALLLAGKPCGATLEPTGAAGAVRARIPVQQIDDAGRLGKRLGLDVGAKRPQPIITAWPLDVDVPESEPGFGLGTTDMVLKVVRDRPQLVVEDVTIDQAIARITGIAAVPAAELRLNGPRGLLAPAAMVREGRRFTAEVPLAVDEAGTLPPATTYALTATHDDRRIRVVAARGLLGRAEVAASADWQVEVDLEMVVAFQRRAAAEVGLGSRRHRQLTRSTYDAARAAPRTREVLLVPSLDEMLRLDLAAVAAHLRDRGVEPVWAARAEDPAPDPTLRTVVRGSEEWYAVLGGAAAVLAAGRLPGDAVPVDGQPWVGLLPRPALTAEPRTEEPDDDSDTELDWCSAPAVPDPAPTNGATSCEPVAPTATTQDVPGEASVEVSDPPGQPGVRVLGAPRTDHVLAEDRASLRSRVRTAMGIAPEALVVFHAPTRRWAGADDDGDEGTRVLLDVPDLLAARPDVVVWGRGRAADWPMLQAAHPDRVRDVTWHAQPLELLAAADALVTDFSPLLVEACLFGTPVVRHLPDDAGVELEETVAPDVGPVAPDLAAVVAGLGHDPAAFAPGRSAVVERFAPADDGGAAARIADALLGPS